MIHKYDVHGRDAAIADIRKWVEDNWPSFYLMKANGLTDEKLHGKKLKGVAERAVAKHAHTVKWRLISMDKWGIDPKILMQASEIIFNEIEEAIKQGKSVSIPNFGAFRVAFSKESNTPRMVFVMDPRWRNAINDPTSKEDLGFFRRVTEDGRIEKTAQV
jgi:nucleoid DNA-binding protein